MTTKRAHDEEESPDAKKPAKSYPVYAQHVRVLITNSQAGAIIGKGGSKVAQIRTATGSELQILSNDGPSKERILIVKGDVASNANALAMAAGAMLEDTNNRKEGAEPDSSITIRILIFQYASGAIIGKGGTRIREIMAESDTKIQISTEPLPHSTEKICNITGTEETLRVALVRVLQQLHDNPPRPGTHIAEFSPSATPPPVDKYPQQQQFPAYPAMGFPQYQQIPQFQQQQQPQPPTTGSNGTETIMIPTSEAGSVIGKGGSRIRELRAQTGTNISIADALPSAPQERAVNISGPPTGIQTAIAMIRQLVETQGQSMYIDGAAAVPAVSFPYVAAGDYGPYQPYAQRQTHGY